MPCYQLIHRLFLIITSFLVLSNAQAEECNHPDFDALMAIYTALNGPNWENQTGWADGAAGINCDPCDGTWFNLACNDENRVNRLYLSAYNNIWGNLPAEIGALIQLDTLVIAGTGCALFGELPIQLWDLTSLRRLFISNCSELNVELPPEIGNLTELRYLKIYGGQNNGSLPPEIGNLTNLIQLRLYGNEFSGNLPSEIGNLQNLEELRLENNQLTGELPAEIGNMQSLIEINLSTNNFEGELPKEIGNLQNLVDVDLRNNSLEGEVPGEIGNMQNLLYLNLRSNNFTGISTDIVNAQSLIIFDIGYNMLEGCIDLTLCDSINNLKLANNPLIANQGIDFCDLYFEQNLSQIGAPCDDGDITITNDFINADCTCGNAIFEPDDSYVSVLNNSAIWNYFQIDTSNIQNQPSSLQIIGDTIIDNKNCFLIDYDCTCCVGTNILYYNGQGKMYGWDEDSLVFRLLFNSKLEADDQFYSQWLDGYEISYEIDSVRWLFTENDTLRIQYISEDYNDLYIGESVTEIIGSNRFFFPLIADCFPATGPLTCYEDDLNGLIQFQSDNFCNLIEPVSSEFTSESLLNIFPNPASDIIYITLDGSSNLSHQISIMDVSGNMILNQEYNNQNKINIESLIPGLYYLQINNNEELIVKKFIKSL